MPYKYMLLVMLSVLLAASAQLLMKAGMSAAAIRRTFMSGEGPVALILAAAQSPLVLLGLCTFGVSVIVWLLILAKIDVSQAYPFVSLGIVITAIGGHFLLGEPLNFYRIAGIGAIVCGLLLVTSG